MRKTLLLLFLVLSLNASSQSWHPKADFPDCQSDGVTFAIGIDVYFGLGVLCNGIETTNFYKFNTSSNTWSAIATFPGPTRRKASSFVINGKGYVCLGLSNNSPLNDLWQYDPGNNSWIVKTSFPGVGREAAIAEVINNKAYVGTGFSPSSGYPMDMFAYNPIANNWTFKMPMPGTALFAAQSFAIGDTMYVVGGIGGNLLLEQNEFWAYSASANSWIQKPDFPGGLPRLFGTSFSLNGFGYYGFGKNGSNFIGDFYSYNPASGLWTTVPSIGIHLLFNDGGGGAATSTAGYCISGVTYNNQSPPGTAVWEFLPAVGIDEQSYTNDKILIAPNPANEYFEIKSAFTGDFILVNSLGQTMQKLVLKSNEVYRFDASSLKAGTYIIKSVTSPSLIRRITILK